MSKRSRWSGGMVVLNGAMLGLGASLPVHAELNLDVGLGAEAHSNVDLRSEDERSDVARTASVGITYARADDGVFVADASYRGGYEDYLHDVEEDRTVLSGAASGTWHVLSRRLDLNFSHQIEDTLANRREADTADNQDRRSVTSVGLDGFLHFSPVDSLVLSPRFTDVRFKDNDQSDSERKEMVARLNRQLSQVSAVDLSANYTKATFDASEDDYKQKGVMLSYQAALARLSYEIGVGVSRIERDNEDDVSGSRGRIAATYLNDRGQSFRASFLHELTDSSVGLSGSGLSSDFSSRDSNFEEVDIVKIDQFDLGWSIPIRQGDTLTLGAGFTDRDYQDTPRDEQVAQVQAGYSHTINSRWSVSAGAQFERSKFTDAPKTEYDDTTFDVGATYRLSSVMDLRLSVGREKRSADDAGIDYEDDYAILSFNYRVF